MNQSRNQTSAASPRRHTAGLFDIRTIIGALLVVYGVILALMGLFADPETDKTGGVNANLWTGVVLLVAGLLFVGWARLRPVVVPTDTGGAETGSAPPSNH
ncbi:hypothetical protein [Nocardioides ferulae]|uniref:hypothetical protein n=1 Tax=Nocardioides ferulae TaxID=2340821 RepID=UPI000EB04BDC|nr:hypothetical protein [Nocardioides ferulae]